jgi:hypothetical protein
MAAQILSVEYCGLTMRTSIYSVYGREHSSHRVNWTMCAAFDTKFAVSRASTCPIISNSGADSFSRMLKPEYAEL